MQYRRFLSRGMKFAAELALQSDSPTYRVGAALMMKSRVVSLGRNHYRKTSPKSTNRHHTIHAELSCLSCFLHDEEEDLSGATLFVARITNGGNWAMARPCEDCEKLIKTLGLKAIYFTDRDGKIQRFYP